MQEIGIIENPSAAPAGHMAFSMLLIEREDDRRRYGVAYRGIVGVDPTGAPYQEQAIGTYRRCDKATWLYQALIK